MEKNLLLEINPSRYFVYGFRFVCVILMVYLFVKLHKNIIGITIVFVPIISLLIYSATINIKVYNDSIKFRFNRLIPILTKEYSYFFTSIQKVEVEEMKVNIFILIFSGIGGIKDSRIVFHFLDGSIKEEIIRARPKDVKNIYEIISSRIKSNSFDPRRSDHSSSRHKSN